MVGPKLIIKQQKSVSWYVGIGIVAVVALLSSYSAGRYFAAEAQSQAQERAEWLENELHKFEKAYKQTSEELVMQVQSGKVDDQSNQQLVETVKRLQEVQYQLESELAFYRKIMAPEKDLEGLTIANFNISQESAESNPKFKLVLTQAGKQEQFLKGTVEFSVSGTLNGVEKVFKFSELGAFQKKDFQFQFRYFQNIEGELQVPEGFIAEIVNIQAKTHGLRKNQTVEKQFNWKS